MNKFLLKEDNHIQFFISYQDLVVLMIMLLKKSGFARYAHQRRIAVVFPDTSPRNTGIAGISEDWEAGDSASYYVDATNDKTKQFFQMFSYINK